MSKYSHVLRSRGLGFQHMNSGGGTVQLITGPTHLERVLLVFCQLKQSGFVRDAPVWVFLVLRCIRKCTIIFEENLHELARGYQENMLTACPPPPRSPCTPRLSHLDLLTPGRLPSWGFCTCHLFAGTFFPETSAHLPLSDPVIPKSARQRPV